MTATATISTSARISEGKRMGENHNNVIIAGSRTFDDYALLERILGEIFTAEGKPTLIICGEARGADSLGRRYAQERGIPVASFPADWKKYGRSAGFRRNAEMLRVADCLIAFWDGKSVGTKHMIEISRKAGIRVHVQRQFRAG